MKHCSLWFRRCIFCVMSVCATLAAPTARAQSAREVNALWQKAQAAQREGRWDAAIKSFLVLTALYPTDANAAVGWLQLL
jgi:outer membrane protein assembly factor BamD (BamD/ComL family)